MFFDPDFSGWQPRVLACTECDSDQLDPTCWMCGGTGLHACSGHVVNDALIIDDQIVATLEAFADAGPWYVNAISPTGEHKRRAINDHAAAAQWAEVLSGYRIANPAAMAVRADSLTHQLDAKRSSRARTRGLG